MTRASISVLTMVKGIGVLLIVLCLSATAFPSAGSDQKTVKAGSPRAWALAATAILTERNNHRHDILGGCVRTGANVAHWKGVLYNWWNIRDREDLLKTLKWIEDNGHRSDFEKLGSFIASLNDEQKLTLSSKLSDNKEAKHEIEAVERYYQKLGRKSLLGWDYSRYISLCRLGYMVGYLTESEAWARIITAAAILQRTFDSWKDLGENYFIGREFWSYEMALRDGRLYRDTYRRLLNNGNSPWKLNPWTVRLF